MRLLVYEFVTGGGLWTQPGEPLPAGGLLREGRAMAEALCDDLRQAGHQIELLWDARIPRARFAESAQSVSSCGGHWRSLQAAVEAAQHCLVIAPETAGSLQQVVRRVVEAGGQLLSPDPAFCALTSDKSRTAERLAEAGVPAPAHWDGPWGVPDPSWRWPAVQKPRDACGSVGVGWVRDAAEAACALAIGWRVEQFCPGLPASVAVLCGPAERRALPACQQRLRPGSFDYCGGRAPLSAQLDRRARRLATRALDALPATRGYVGVDLVLGEPPDGAGDVVIEVNPRLTTSYLGLRRLAQPNLGQALIDVARGRPAALTFSGATQWDVAVEGDEGNAAPGEENDGSAA